METLSLESCSTIHLQPCWNSGLQQNARRKGPMLSTGNWRYKQTQRCSIQALKFGRSSNQVKLPTFSIFCSSYNGGCTVSETEPCISEEALLLKKKADEISIGLEGKSIFLVGMMGCGKTTVGKILSEALGYYFFDSDRLIEQAAGGTSVAQIFKEKNEEYFRDNETKVLGELSTMHRLVVATGGGAVVRPQNWTYLYHGVTVWLDVPLEALAKRIAAVGTESRPLLGQASIDPYAQAFARLQQLIEKRGEAYGNSNARVSLQKIAAEIGCVDVSDLTPTTIAIEVLEEIGNFLRCNNVKNGTSNTKANMYNYIRKL
uniref:shikimate kinase n=1 Tax=Wollemia nobilis TaxID=56998 RepID=A0A0C9QTX3_9CONI